MKAMKQTLSLGLASLLVAAMPLQAAAASPDFARTAEEWARLQDDVIEYDELAALVHEYNATVQKNQIDFNEFRKEYGDSNEKVARRYRELADEIKRDITYPGNGDDNYASQMMSIVSLESQVDSLLELADDAVDDSTIHYLTNKLAEDSLVMTAQINMISYYRNELHISASRLRQEINQENLQAVSARRTAGTATEVDVLNAQETIRTEDQTMQQKQSDLETVRQTLLVMLGWKHDASPQISVLPTPDMGRITAMDPTTDKVQAIENNYTLKINKRKLENAKNTDTRETLERTIRENEQMIGTSVNTAYQNVISVKTAYDLSVAQASLDQRNLDTASRNYQLGTISRNQYLAQKNNTEIANINVKIAEYNLLEAIESYNWIINGMANAG